MALLYFSILKVAKIHFFRFFQNLFLLSFRQNCLNLSLSYQDKVLYFGFNRNGRKVGAMDAEGNKLI